MGLLSKILKNSRQPSENLKDATQNQNGNEEAEDDENSLSDSLDGESQIDNMILSNQANLRKQTTHHIQDLKNKEIKKQLQQQFVVDKFK